jgi:hypothetical protein
MEWNPLDVDRRGPYARLRLAAQDNHRWTVRVSASAAGEATAFARKHRFAVGAPAAFDEADPHVSAVEYVLGALGADLVNGFVALARARRLSIDHAEAVVQGELASPLAHLGVIGASGSPGLAELRVKAYVSSNEDEALVRKTWDEMLERSPLVHTLRTGVRLELDLKSTP